MIIIISQVNLWINVKDPELVYWTSAGIDSTINLWRNIV